MKLLVFFIALNLFNVVIQTIKSLFTVKGDKWSSAFISGFTYFVYTYVLIYMNVEGITTLMKAIIVGLCNVVGVFVVKLIEEKSQKDKLWVVHATARERLDNVQKVYESLKGLGIKSIYTEIVKNELYSLEIFSYTQKESEMIKGILDNYNIKYCATETKNF